MSNYKIIGTTLLAVALELIINLLLLTVIIEEDLKDCETDTIIYWFIASVIFTIIKFIIFFVSIITFYLTYRLCFGCLEFVKNLYKLSVTVYIVFAVIWILVGIFCIFWSIECLDKYITLILISLICISAQIVDLICIMMTLLLIITL